MNVAHVATVGGGVRRRSTVWKLTYMTMSTERRFGGRRWRTATTAHVRQRKRIVQLGDKEGSECGPDQASCSREGCGGKECEVELVKMVKS
jgi:hypothetical protein